MTHRPSACFVPSILSRNPHHLVLDCARVCLVAHDLQYLWFSEVCGKELGPPKIRRWISYDWAVCAKSLQSCPTLCNPMDYSLPGSSVHGFSKQEYCCGLPCPPSRGSSQPRDRTWVSCIAGRFFTIWATREAPCRAITPIKFLSSDHFLNTKNVF